MTIQSIKNKSLPILKDNDIEFAGIFGSYVAGTAHKNSDIDLLVRFSKPKTLIDIVGMEGILSEILKKKVDLVTEKSLSPYIKKQVLNSLEVL